jgi:WD40 repeat protein
VATLFISHSSVDVNEARAVGAELRRLGAESLFLDVDPEQGIEPGRRWQDELYLALRRCHAVVVLATEASAASKWCFAEVAVARSAGKQIYWLGSGQHVADALLRDIQGIAVNGDVRGSVQRLWRALERDGIARHARHALEPGRAPYPGLRPLEEEDAAVFFGRDEDTDEIVRRLQPGLVADAQRVLALVGPSGSGKSSLIRAGIVPRLKQATPPWAVLPPFSPHTAPLAAMAGAFAQLLEEDWRALERRLTDDAESIAGLVDRAAGATRAQVLVVVDQAEELVTRGTAETRRPFLRALESLSREGANAAVVVLLRSEFLTEFLTDPELEPLVRDTRLVAPLPSDRLVDVIVEPARGAGLAVEDGLAAQMTADTGSGDALPLLAYALQQLYAVGRDTGELRRDDYRRIGGVVGALRQRADEARDQLTRDGRGAEVLPTLLELTSVTREGTATRRRVEREALRPERNAVVDAFVAARLLKTDENEDGGTTVEVAHEALLREWPPLRDAIAESRDELRIRDEVVLQAKEWERHDRSDDYLVLRGERLQRARDVAAKSAAADLQAAGDYLEANRRQERWSGRRERLLRWGMRIAAVLLLVVVAAMLVLYLRADGARQDAEREQRVATARAVTARAIPAAGEVRGEAQALLARYAYALDRRLGGALGDRVYEALSGITTRQPFSRSLAETDSLLSDVAFSPDGRWLADADRDGVVRVHDRGHMDREPLRLQLGPVSALAFDHAGSQLVTLEPGRGVRMWRLPSGEPAERQPGPAEGFGKLAVSPDGRTLVTGGEAGAALWQLRGERSQSRSLAGPRDVTSVALEPRTGRIASGDRQGRVWLHRLAAPSLPPTVLRGHTDLVWALNFSPDGRRLASGSYDRTVLVRDAAKPEASTAVRLDCVMSSTDVEFSPDGRLIGCVARRTLRVWQTARMESEPRTFRLDQRESSAMSFAPDSKSIAVAAEEGAVQILALDGDEALRALAPVHLPRPAGVERTFDVAFSSDDERVVTAGDDGGVRVWSVHGGDPVLLPKPHTAVAFAAAWLADGRIVGGGLDGSLRFWNPQRPGAAPQIYKTGPAVQDLAAASRTPLLVAAVGSDVLVAAPGRPLRPLQGHADRVDAVAVDAAGHWIASGGLDGTLLVQSSDGREHHLARLGEYVDAVAMSADGRRAAVTTIDNRVLVWDHLRDATPRVLGAHSAEPEAVAFSPDGRSLATGDNNGVVWIWDLEHERVEPTTLRVEDRVLALEFSSDGRRLAISGEGGAATIVTPPSVLADAVCRVVSRNLSQAEWGELVSADTPYVRICPDLPVPPG